MTRAEKINRKRREYLNAVVGGRRQEARRLQRELVNLIVFQVRAEDREDKRKTRAA